MEEEVGERVVALKIFTCRMITLATLEETMVEGVEVGVLVEIMGREEVEVEEEGVVGEVHGEGIEVEGEDGGEMIS